MHHAALRVIWFVPPALAVAAEQETLPKVRVEGRRTLSSDEQFTALSEGSVDAAVTSMDNVLHWNQRPGPRDFVIVAQLESTTPLLLIGRPGIGGLQELRGADLLVDAPENGFVIALRALLAEAGLERISYRLTPVGGVRERFDALLAGQGAATLLGPPFVSLALAQGLVELASVQACYPHFPGQGLVVSRSRLERRGLLGTWLSQLSQALLRLSENTDDLGAALASQGLPTSAVEAMLATLPRELVPDPRGIELLITQRRRLGLVGSNATYQQIVDTSLLNQVG
jgi:ABC-type nitrate/sulfonate/bicarbonate transport system substrate-binding protein